MKRIAKCYGYGRHSTDKQELTQEAQEYRTKDYFHRNLRDRGVEWAGFYYDEAKTGSKPFSERPFGRTVFSIAQPGDHIVVAKLDRSFRSVQDGISVMEQLAGRGVIFHSLDLLIDTSTPLGKFFRNVLLSVAELERGFTSERVKEIVALRKREGKPYGKSCPVGWKIMGSRPDRYYRVDDNERMLVDRMQQCRSRGMSYEDIALWQMHLKDVQIKRIFPTRQQVKWALNARRANYPKIAGYREFNRLVKSGEIALRFA